MIDSQRSTDQSQKYRRDLTKVVAEHIVHWG